MTAAVRTRLAEGMLRPGELHAEWTPYRHRRDGRATGVVVGLSHSARVEGYFNPPYDDGVRSLASAGMAVVVPGTSGSSWGNDDAIDGIGRAVAHLREELGCRDQVGLLGYSMGALAVCGWARSHVHEVAAIALVTPAVDLAHQHEQGVYRREIEHAHRGRHAFAAALPTLDPHAYAASLTSIPIRVWYSRDDPVIPWQTVASFAERHGGNITLIDLGPVGHNPAAAPGTAIADFFAEH